MTKKTRQLLIQIAQQGAKLKEVLDFIQADGHFMERSKKLQSLGIKSIQGTARVSEYRDLIIQHQLMLIVADYTLCKHPFARWRYNKLLNRVYKYLNEVKLDDSAGKV